MDWHPFLWWYVEPHSHVHNETFWVLKVKNDVIRVRTAYRILYLKHCPVSCIIFFETAQTLEQASTHRTNRFKTVAVKLVLTDALYSHSPQVLACLVFCCCPSLTSCWLPKIIKLKFLEMAWQQVLGHSLGSFRYRLSHLFLWILWVLRKSSDWQDVHKIWLCVPLIAKPYGNRNHSRSTGTLDKK